MKRWFKRIGIALLLIVIILFGPVAWNETACRPKGDVMSNTSLLPTEHHRNAARTLLTYPEWHIVHAYDDYARVLETGDPHDYGYIRGIAGFWGSLCQLSRASGPLGGFDWPTKQMVYVIGVSFTAELLMKAAYEETLGRVATWVRGAQPATLDQTSAQHARNYANFLQQVPWYKWDFRKDKAELSRDTTGGFRNWERKTALGLEYGTKAAYADVIAQAVASTGFDELTLRLVVDNFSVQDIAKFEGVTFIDALPEGLVLETPRYRELTHILKDMADLGANFVEIAGNDTIMFTATVAADTVSSNAIYSAPRQGYGDTRQLVVVDVTNLAQTLRDLPDDALEHIHDY